MIGCEGQAVAAGITQKDVKRIHFFSWSFYTRYRITQCGLGRCETVRPVFSYGELKQLPYLQYLVFQSVESVASATARMTAEDALKHPFIAAGLRLRPAE